MKRAIISFANSRGNYIHGLARLSESLRNNFDGDFIGWVHEESLGCYLHSEVPYAFKVAAFEKAIKAHYDQILWLDASAFAIKNVSPIFDEITKDGFIFQEAGHLVGTWTNDFTLNYFGITRDEAIKMPMIGNAGFLGLDMNTNVGRKFFNEWKMAMEAGCFKGSWEDHRHDMSCSSIIANKMGIIQQAKRGDEWLQYATMEDPTLNDTIIIKAAGL